MKKLTVLITLLFSLAVGATAQNGGGLFQKGPEPREYGNRTTNEVPLLPSQHGETTDQSTPLGSGAAIMLGLGAAYLMGKKRKSVRKATLALALFVAVGAPFAAMAQQTTITIGSGDQNAPLPSNGTWNCTISQQIYTPEDINTAGEITSIAFYNGTSNQQARNLDIYMAHTDKNVFTSNTDWINISNSDKVYEGGGNTTFSRYQWTTLTLQNHFAYDGTHNLVVVVIDKTGNSVGTVPYINQYRVFSTNGNQTLQQSRSNWTISNVHPNGTYGNETITGVLYSYKNQIQLGIIPVTQLPFVEDFESSNSLPTDWSTEGSGEWKFGDQYHYCEQGTQYAYFRAFGNNDVTKLITPILNLQGTGTFELSFLRYMPHPTPPAQSNELKVYYRTSENGDWTLIQTYTDDAPSWTLETITLPNANGGYQIAFEATDKSGMGIVYHGGPVCLDYVKITQKHTKDITGYGEGNGNWYLIASPLAAPAAPMDVTDMTSNSYDLYRFNQSTNKEWENWKATGTNHYQFTMEPGQGYLYANSGNVTLQFFGTPYNSNGQVPLVYDANAPRFAGWNLIGNSFSTAATIDRPFYRMNNDGTALSAQVEANNSVAAMEGVFVQATDANQTATFTPSNGGAKGGETPLLNISVNRNRGEAVDNAIVRFDGGQTLDKFTLHENDSRLYIPQDSQEHAIANAEATGELPLNFLPEADGTYTLSFESEAIEFSYLHLIDNMTGADVDLMVTPSYTFEARYSDYASRFRLVFSAGSNNGDAASGNETFAFVDVNGNIIVTDGPSTGSGTSTLQIMDMMGRVIRSTDVARNVSTSEMAPGVYVLRLIDGETVRTQKIVID